METCRKEVEKVKGKPDSMKNNVLEAFTPGPADTAAALKAIDEHFPGVRDKLSPITVEAHTQLAKDACDSNPGAGAVYQMFGGKRLIAMCSMAFGSMADFVDSFRHEAVHAMQMNLGDKPASAMEDIFKFATPLSEELAVASELSRYTMNGGFAGHVHDGDDRLEKARASMETQFSGDAELTRLFHAETGFQESPFLALSNLGEISVTTREPLKLGWAPRTQANGGEEAYKKLLLERLLQNNKGYSCTNRGGYDMICPFTQYFEANCARPGVPSTADLAFQCLKNFKTATLNDIEKAAKKSAAAKTAITELIDAKVASACTGLAMYCTENQANSTNKISKSIRVLNARELGISAECQARAFSMETKDATMLDHRFKAIRDAYDQAAEGDKWSKLQEAAIADTAAELHRSYGLGGYDGLSGFGTLKPATCQKSPDLNSCQSHSYDTPTPAAAPKQAVDGTPALW